MKVIKKGFPETFAGKGELKEYVSFDQRMIASLQYI